MGTYSNGDGDLESTIFYLTDAFEKTIIIKPDTLNDVFNEIALVIQQPTKTPEQKGQLAQIYKMICDKINGGIAVGGCENINKSAVELFKKIYNIDYNISVGISPGAWGTFKRNCLNIGYKDDTNYFSSKLARTRNMFGFGNKRRTKRNKKNKRTKRNKHSKK